MFIDNSGNEIRPKRAMHDMKGNGGPINDYCCHLFDMWRMVFSSEPTWASARGFTFARDRPELAHIKEVAPDTAALVVEHASGDLGVVTISRGLPQAVHLQANSCILGPKGIIILGSNQLTIKGEGGLEEKISFASADSKAIQIQHFGRVVLGEAELQATGKDGRKALQVSLGHP